MKDADSFMVRQQPQFLPKHCCSCPPCVKQENIYTIYAGSANGEQELLRMQEVSDDCNRCCCAPYHPLKIEVKQNIPQPGDPGFSDMNWLTKDYYTTFEKADRNNKFIMMDNFYAKQPALMTILREDGQRCLPFPCCLPHFKMRWLSTFVCFNCCVDGVHIYAGGVDGDEKERGRFSPQQKASIQNSLIGSVMQPMFGGGCRPTMHLKTGDDNNPDYAKVF